MKKRLLIILIGICVVAMMAAPLIMTGCGEEKETTAPTTQPTTTVPEGKPADYYTKEYILIGASRPLSGANAPIGDAAYGPVMKMWEEKVNADGGIFVADYDRKLPIKFIIYDDATDIGTMVRLTEKLILEDEVDLLFSACGTAFISAQAPIANKYSKLLITAEGGATTMRESLPGLPYVFVSLPFSDHYQLPVFADMCAAKGAKTAYIISIADLHGVEYGGVANMEFGRVGIDVIANKSVPITYTDFSLLVKEAKAADPDVFCVFAYPPIVLPVTGEMMAIGFNPPAVIMGPGANFGFYGLSFGGDPLVVEGVTCFAAANSKTSPEFAEAFAALEELVGWANLDWWGAPYYLPLVEIIEQAIVATGTLDNDVLRDYIATHHFDTILGDTYFEMFGEGGGLMVKETHPGEIGQWQNGIVEIVGGGDWPAVVLTSEWVYPKPDWPAP
ncbi:MAG TPA: ABC transporter substrate-binding protein [Dehalococcoidia bacterium]|nr:ABC transporter substrate-binding protein [Dehalococcoidia bacterium]